MTDADLADSPPAELRPILLQPRLVKRMWGTDSLGPWFPPPEPGQLVGEVWLTALECQVEGAESTLGDIVRQPGHAWGCNGDRGFPLLIKLLYPREKLSVQVHPNDAQAQGTLGQPRGKTECWYVLSAEPGAAVAVGFREPMTVEQVRAAIGDGTVEQHMRMLPVQAGDMVFVDAGTVHAIGPGMVVLETQQYSDVTFRLWDYGRPRDLHVEEGLAVTRTETAAGMVAPVPMGGFDRLVQCAYFTVDRFRLAPGPAAVLGREGGVQVLIALGDGTVLHQEGASGRSLPPGHALVVPADGPSCVVEASAPVELIRVLGPA